MKGFHFRDIFFRQTRAEPLNCGDAAPDFELEDQQGQRHRLDDYRGRWLLLYFYPKDDTPGCTREACGFRDDFGALRDLDAAILGVSLDNANSHQRFAGKYALSFPLLTDKGGRTAAAYGALLALGPLKLTRRHSFLIDPDGRIARIYRSVKPAQHSGQVLADLRSISGRYRS